eukprot:s789_g9.t3
MFNVDARNYELSRRVDFFDDFLSHDWGTPRWSKLCNLLIIYNSGPAFLATLLVCPLISICRLSEVIPNNRWTACLGYAVHLLVLCFWQRLRLVFFCRPLMVFLDKLCIAQGPEQAELKKKGILGLAAFLNHSRRLVVLWSPRYFSRLWCAYEIATFLTNRNRQKDILVVPIVAGPILLLLYLCWAWVLSCIHIVLGNMEFFGVSFTFDATTSQVPGPVVLQLMFLILSPALGAGLPVNVLAAGVAKQLQQVRQQLQKFQVQDTLCFCCSNDHKHPETGADIPCDRELVYRKLHEWYGRPTDTGEEPLRRFNELVRRRLGEAIVSKMPSSVPLAPCIYMLGAASMPWLSDALERIFFQLTRPDNPHDPVYWTWRCIIEWVFLSLASFLGARMSLSFSMFWARVFPNVSTIWLGLLTLVTAGTPTILVVAAFLYIYATDADIWPMTIFFLFALLATLLILPICPCRSGGAGRQELQWTPDDVTPSSSKELEERQEEPVAVEPVLREASTVSLWST